MFILILSLLGFLLNAYAEEVALRDPTQPPAYKHISTNSNISSNDLNITAIFAGKNPRVMIGNNFYTLGDKISDATITAIDADGITLKNEDGEETKVAMLLPTVKTPTTKQEGKP
jgi:hypothetical protein